MNLIKQKLFDVCVKENIVAKEISKIINDIK